MHLAVLLAPLAWCCLAWLAQRTCAGAAAEARARPHILHIVVDDWGWGEVGYHLPAGSAAAAEVHTPNIDALRADGLELNRYYTYKICSPARCALQTGRNPIHVNVQNVVPEDHNPKDPLGGYQGIPLNMTTIGAHLQGAGYTTHIVGKWDVGMATPRHTPAGRGYSSFLGYFHHANDYWQHTVEDCKGVSQKDLWRQNASDRLGAPATDLANAPGCSQAHQASTPAAPCVFEEHLLARRVKHIIAQQDAAPAAARMFLLWSMHLVHMPLQVPEAYEQRFSAIKDPFRRKMRAMVNVVDDEVGEVVALLQSRGLWEQTLVVIHSDNGGEIEFAGVCGGCNWPLRGGKFSNFEGGIRVNALVGGGFLPAPRRGQVEHGYITTWDWYATYAALAGVSHADPAAAAAGLPPPDSIDVSGTLLLAAPSPRREIVIGDTSAILPNSDGRTLVGGLINGDLKLLLGREQDLYLIDQATLTPAVWPDGSSHIIPSAVTRECGRAPARGCLYNITEDPREMVSVAAALPLQFAAMLARVDVLQRGVYSPKRAPRDSAACAQATGPNGGYWGPWLEL